ncbi:hypothetical protein [Sporisorium scitamineum]|uniref:Uncharacterized protein n=1 Tax=Sporisorium scitamineum TaxID=49012 RepID=A0A0F7S7U8_9BASI|nr:hypothetical protein [Sporisorium scitamineum]
MHRSSPILDRIALALSSTPPNTDPRASSISPTHPLTGARQSTEALLAILTSTSTPLDLRQQNPPSYVFA